MGALTVADLVPGDDEPRIKDLVLAERLGFALLYDIRKLIRRNEAELLRYGALFATVTNNHGGRGRLGKAFHLNEAQSLLICVLSGAERAADVREEVIKAYLAHRRGELVPAEGSSRRGTAKALPSGLSENQAAEARARIAILKRVDRLAASGLSRTQAIANAAQEAGISSATIWDWLKRRGNTPPEQQLTALAPGWTGGGRRAEIQEDIWLVFLGAQLERHNAARAYRLAQSAANAAGHHIPHCKTFLRRFQKAAADALRTSLSDERAA